MNERAQPAAVEPDAQRARAERDAKLRAIGVDPAQLVDERDVEYLLGDAFRQAGVEYGEKEQAAVVCTLLGYRYPDSLQVGDRPPALRFHPLAGGDAVPIGQLHRERPLVLFFGSYT
jgi:hypothetical protein